MKEELLGFPVTEFSKLDEAEENIGPHDRLWKLVVDAKYNTDTWEKAPVKTLDIDEIERQCKSMLGEARKLKNLF